LLPEKRIEPYELADKGYDVVYSNSEDSFTDILDLYDCVKVQITKNGLPASPDGHHSTEYFDKKSKELIAVMWHNDKGEISRKNDPAFICCRTNKTGAYGGERSYTCIGYVRDGVFHNSKGAALIMDEHKSDGLTIRVHEDTVLGGKLIAKTRRDENTGDVILEVLGYDCGDFPEP
jgi:hypothetical protein